MNNDISFLLGASLPIQLDGGAQSSMFRDKSLFEFIEPCNNDFVCGFMGNPVKIIGLGKALGIRNCIYIPSATMNLISEFDLYDEGYVLTNSNDTHRVYTNWEDNSMKWIFYCSNRKWLLLSKPLYVSTKYYSDCVSMRM
jgi:hypothetical protein